MIRAGSESPTLPPLVGFGPRTRYVHGVHTDRQLARGEHMVLELAGVRRRYNATLMRTAALGDPGIVVTRAYDVISRAWEVSMAAIRPGSASGKLTARAGGADRFAT